MKQKTQIPETEKNRLIYFLLSLMCLFTSVIYIFKGLNDNTLAVKFTFFLISVSIFLIPFLFLKTKTAFYLSIIYVIFSPFEIVHLFMYGTGISPGLIQLIFQTNITEAFEIVTSFSFLAIIYLLLIICYIALLVRIKKEKGYLLNKKNRLIVGIFIALLFTSIYIFKFSDGFRTTKSIAEAFNDSNKSLLRKVFKTYPVDMFYATQNALSERYRMNHFSEGIENFKFNAKSDNQLSEREIYVLVIGETARYSNFGINGFYRNTSPNLKKIHDIFTFQNVYSEANFTEGSIPVLLSRATAKDFYISVKEKTVLEAFKEAGFDTYWISNQSLYNQFIKRIMTQTTKNYTTKKKVDINKNYDTSIFPDLEKVLSENKKKQFIVIHSLGSHFRYNYRYPDEFKKFTPAFEGAFDYTEMKMKNKDILINTYDNSILFTDYFLAGVIQKLQKQSCLSYMFYISDHGENLLDNGNKILHAEIDPTRYEVHVPLFVWTSDKFRAYFPDKITAMQRNITNQISSSVTFYSLLDLANIKLPDMKYQKSIASKDLKNDTIIQVLTPNMEIIDIK